MEFLESFDQSFWNGMQGKRQPWLDPALTVISFLALPAVLAVLTAIVALIAASWRRFGEAGLVAAAYLGSFLLATLLAWLIERPPPDVKVRPLEEPLTTSSFPSRETMVATATYMAIALALRPLLGPRGRRYAPIGGLALAGVVAICRAFVGSNYPSDVLAGVLGGLAWVMICYMVAERWLEPLPGAGEPIGPAA
jgi:undecaprenyl-diphosphatase